MSLSYSSLTKFRSQKLIIIPVIIGFLKVIRCQNKAKGAGRKIDFRGPDHWRDVKSFVGSAQMNNVLVSAVVNSHIKTTQSAYNKLFERFVCMRPPALAARYIVNIENALQIKFNFTDGTLMGGRSNQCSQFQ